MHRVPAVEQWLKNLTAVALVTSKAQVQPLALELPYALGTAIKPLKEFIMHKERLMLRFLSIANAKSTFTYIYI